MTIATTSLLIPKKEFQVITLSKENYEKILEHAEKNLPEEACGLIAGRIDGENKHIENV